MTELDRRPNADRPDIESKTRSYLEEMKLEGFESGLLAELEQLSVDEEVGRLLGAYTVEARGDFMVPRAIVGNLSKRNIQSSELDGLKVVRAMDVGYEDRFAPRVWMGPLRDAGGWIEGERAGGTLSPPMAMGDLRRMCEEEGRFRNGELPMDYDREAVAGLASLDVPDWMAAYLLDHTVRLKQGGYVIRAIDVAQLSKHAYPDGTKTPTAAILRGVSRMGNDNKWAPKDLLLPRLAMRKFVYISLHDLLVLSRVMSSEWRGASEHGFTATDTARQLVDEERRKTGDLNFNEILKKLKLSNFSANTQVASTNNVGRPPKSTPYVNWWKELNAKRQSRADLGLRTFATNLEKEGYPVLEAGGDFYVSLDSVRGLLGSNNIELEDRILVDGEKINYIFGEKYVPLHWLMSKFSS